MADTEKIKIVVDVEDNATGRLRNIRGGLSSLQSSVGRFNYALRQYNATMSTFNNSVIRGIKEVGSAIYDFTSDAISNFSELSEQHAKTLGAMANNYDNTLESQRKFIENSEKMKQQAIDLAKNGVYYGTDQYTGQGSLYTATQVSEAQTELVKAGVSDEAILKTNVLSDVIQFAQANQLKTGQAVEFATALGSQFGVKYEDWGGMLDKVSHAADLSVVDVADIVQSMKYAGGITSGLNRSIDEVLGMISVFGNFGLKGSQAGSGIQALMTRLLTGDTTVITDAQKEVAPPKALEAFYNFSNIAKSGGGEVTKDDIKNVKSYEDWSKIAQTGNLRPMDEVVDALETTMESLNDEEQAWFAKKLFGLYQMKSAYALINGDDSDMSLSETIKNIKEQSDGTNANKLSQLLGSQYGQIESLKIQWETTKTEFGMMLEPTTIAVIQELKNFLADPGNYNINWDNIRSALDESCNAIEEAYGSAIADAIHNMGDLTIDIGEVVEKMAPEFGTGMLDILNDLVSGDIFGKDGVFADWEQMLGRMDESLEGLPDNLQQLGDNIINVVDAFGKLAAINMATNIAQLVASVLQIALMTVHAASVIINGTTGIGTGTGGGGTTVTTTDGNGNTVVTTSGGNTQSPKTNGKLYGIGNTVSSVAGAYIGSEVTDGIIDKVVENNYIDDSSQDAQIAETGIKIAGGLGGLKIGSSLWKFVAGGGLKSLGGKLAMDADLALFNAGLAPEMAGGLSASAGAIGGAALILPAGIGMIGYEAYQNHKRDTNAKQTANIVNSGGHVAWDNNGKLIRDENGDVLDIDKLLDEYVKQRAKKSNAYAYMNGNESYYSSAEPEKNAWNLWGHTSGYKNAYKEWSAEQSRIRNNMESEKKQFETVQGNYYVVTGNMLKWDDYKANKDDYDKNYSEIDKSLNSAAVSMQEVANEIKNMDLDKVADQLGIKNWSEVIPPFNVLSNEGRQKAVSEYVFGEDITNITTSIDGLTSALLGNNMLSGLPKSNQTPTVNTGNGIKQESATIDNQITNEITITPRFTMDAPQIKVDVTVKQDGTLLNKNVTLLNPNFNDTINDWYQRTSSQNGSTVKK